MPRTIREAPSGALTETCSCPSWPPLPSRLGVVLILFAMLHVHWLVSFLIGAVPFALTLTYVLLLKQGKPPGYDRDLFDLWTTGRGFAPVVSSQDTFRRLQ
jgi:hypothetical protein